MLPNCLCNMFMYCCLLLSMCVFKNVTMDKFGGDFAFIAFEKSVLSCKNKNLDLHTCIL